VLCWPLVSPSKLISVATYERSLPVSTERVWENVHDWEHLPWLHGGSFWDIELLGSGDWGWRANIGIQPEAQQRRIELELVLESDTPVYLSRTLSGPGAGSEIWTTVEERDDDRSAVTVDFRLPDPDPTGAEALGAGFVRLYTRLWDEDESMMVRRAELLGQPRSPRARSETRELGTLDELRARLPLRVELAGRPYRVLELDGELVAHATTCPHLLGPLHDAPVEDGALRCPWHGYAFDVCSGASADGRRMRLAPAPRVERHGSPEQVRLVLDQSNSAS